MYPRERITADFDALAERLVRTFHSEVPVVPIAVVRSGGFRLPFGRSKQAARA
jgi:hypothetical protein